MRGGIGGGKWEGGGGLKRRGRSALRSSSPERQDSQEPGERERESHRVHRPVVLLAAAAQMALQTRPVGVPVGQGRKVGGLSACTRPDLEMKPPTCRARLLRARDQRSTVGRRGSVRGVGKRSMVRGKAGQAEAPRSSAGMRTALVHLSTTLRSPLSLPALRKSAGVQVVALSMRLRRQTGVLSSASARRPCTKALAAQGSPTPRPRPHKSPSHKSANAKHP